jgi:O-antigen/teichoic acid export membrane protein
MKGRLEIAKNVGSSWFSLGVNILVGIFLSPFILHHLGDTAFGIWVLIFSVTGYYGLFDLGIRSSVVRYVSTFKAVDDMNGMARLINTSLVTYTAIGLVTMVVTFFGSAFVNVLFKIPPDLITTARWLFLMVGASVALGFPAGVFGGILEGLQRFYWVNVTNLASTLVRALLIVIALRHGYGLLMVAFITMALPLLSSVVRAFIVTRILPLQFGWKYVDRGSLREIAHYSGVSFVLMIAYKLRFKTDEIIIGAMLPVAAITYFSIGGRLVDYASDVVASLAQIFVPMSGESDARGENDRLRRIFVAGNRACALIIFPIAAILIILGKSVIEAWVGKQYITQSYPVLLALLIPSTFFLAQAASPRILYGMAKHRTLAWITSMESVANIILSVALIRPLGIFGDALGTAIPLTLTTLYFLPRHLCRTLNVRITTYLREAYGLPLLLCAPTVVALLLVRRWFYAHTYLQVASQIGIGLIPYGLGIAWAVWTKRVFRVPDLQSRRGPDESVVLMEAVHEEP